MNRTLHVIPLGHRTVKSGCFPGAWAEREIELGAAPDGEGEPWTASPVADGAAAWLDGRG